jgi:hypothetical protein
MERLYVVLDHTVESDQLHSRHCFLSEKAAERYAAAVRKIKRVYVPEAIEVVELTPLLMEEIEKMESMANEEEGT